MVTAEQDIEAVRERVKADMKLLRELEDKHFEEVTLPEMQRNIGKCLKYRSSYSCPQTDADYWWIYSKIVGVRDARYRMLHFHIDSRHEMHIEESSCSVLLDGYIPIEHAEFIAAVRPMLAALVKESEHVTTT